MNWANVHFSLRGLAMQCTAQANIFADSFPGPESPYGHECKADRAWSIPTFSLVDSPIIAIKRPCHGSGGSRHRFPKGNGGMRGANDS